MLRMLVIALLVVPATVLAANPHFISGPTSSTDNNRLTVCGSIAGLGNQNVTITLSATADITCINRGGNPPPGLRQNVSGTVSNLRVENGRVTFCVSTDRIENPCPSPMRFTASFSNAQIIVSQGGRVVLRQSV